jgi:hypothetical protein
MAYAATRVEVKLEERESISCEMFLEKINPIRLGNLSYPSQS